MLKGSGGLPACDEIRLGLGRPTCSREQAQKVPGGNRWRAQDSCGWRQNEINSCQGPAVASKLLRRQRYETPLAGTVGSLMDALSEAVEDDVAPTKLRSAPYLGRIETRRERHNDRPRRKFDEADARRGFSGREQAKTAQFDPCQPRPEFAAAGQHEIDARPNEVRLVIARIRERGGAYSRSSWFALPNEDAKLACRHFEPFQLRGWAGARYA